MLEDEREARRPARRGRDPGAIPQADGKIARVVAEQVVEEGERALGCADARAGYGDASDTSPRG
jgi:hypothetical protein